MISMRVQGGQAYLFAGHGHVCALIWRSPVCIRMIRLRAIAPQPVLPNFEAALLSPTRRCNGHCTFARY